MITNDTQLVHPPPITTGGTALSEVKDFKYLETWVNLMRMAAGSMDVLREKSVINTAGPF